MVLRLVLAALSLLLGFGLEVEDALAQVPDHWRGTEIRVGVLAHDVPHLWSGFSLENGVDINAEVLFAYGLPFLGGSIRPAIGGSVNTVGDTSRAYVDARWQVDSPSGIFFGLGIGAAIHDGLLDPTRADRKALGSRVLFHIPIELGYRFDQHNSISVYFEHTSNGGLADYNEGLDAIGVRYGYRF